MSARKSMPDLYLIDRDWIGPAIGTWLSAVALHAEGRRGFSTAYIVVACVVAVYVVGNGINFAIGGRSSPGERVGVALWWVANAFAILALMFAKIYWTIGTKVNFGVELSRVDALYFSLGTLTTAGTGTIAPTSSFARGLVSVQMALDFVFVATAVTIVITRWSEKSSVKDQPASQPPASEGDQPPGGAA
jgi:hypothetical protein